MKFEKFKRSKLKIKTMKPQIKWGVLPLINQSSKFIRDDLYYDDLFDNFTCDFNFIQTQLRSYKLVVTDENFTEFFDYSDTIFYKYSLLRYSSLINFFEKQQIDIPRCFKHVKSARRLNFEQPLLKFTNYLTKKGKKEKIFKILNASFFYIFKDHKKTPLFIQNSKYTQWLQLYYFYNNVFQTPTKVFSFSFNLYLKNTNNNFTRRREIYHFSQNTFKAFIFKTLFFLQPLFQFSVYSIDKNVKKFTRKKGSKYVFIWKFIPLYRRRIKLLRLLINDIKFNSGKTLQSRVSNSLSSLYLQPQSSYLAQTTNFAHNYVFKNFKKSLLSTFKTTN